MIVAVAFAFLTVCIVIRVYTLRARAGGYAIADRYSTVNPDQDVTYGMSPVIVNEAS